MVAWKRRAAWVLIPCTIVSSAWGEARRIPAEHVYCAALLALLPIHNTQETGETAYQLNILRGLVETRMASAQAVAAARKKHWLSRLVDSIKPDSNKQMSRYRLDDPHDETVVSASGLKASLAADSRVLGRIKKLQDDLAANKAMRGFRLEGKDAVFAHLQAAAELIRQADEVAYPIWRNLDPTDKQRYVTDLTLRVGSLIGAYFVTEARDFTLWHASSFLLLAAASSWIWLKPAIRVWEFSTTRGRAKSENRGSESGAKMQTWLERAQDVARSGDPSQFAFSGNFTFMADSYFEQILAAQEMDPYKVASSALLMRFIQRMRTLKIRAGVAEPVSAYLLDWILTVDHETREPQLSIAVRPTTRFQTIDLRQPPWGGNSSRRVDQGAVDLGGIAVGAH